MKRTKKEFNEALGVPEGLVKTAQRAFEDFKQEFKRELNPDQTEYEFSYTPSEPYRIADMDIDTINFKINLHPTDRSDEVDAISMGVEGKGERGERKNRPVILSVDKEGNTYFHMDLVTPEEWSEEDVIDFFNRKRVENVKSFSHELKHEYDEFKTPHQSLANRIDYTISKDLIRGFPPLSKLAFNMYFINQIESLVRPSEMAAEIDELGITKEQFLDFLTNNQTYKKLKEINQFTVDQLKEELRPYVGEIRQLLDEFEDEPDPYEKSDDEVIERMMEIFFITLANKSNEAFYHSIITHPLEKIFGLPPKKEKWFNDFMKKNERYENNPMRFFDNTELEFKYKSNKVMRKLAKLYDYIKQNPSD